VGNGVSHLPATRDQTKRASKSQRRQRTTAGRWVEVPTHRTRARWPTAAEGRGVGGGARRVPREQWRQPRAPRSNTHRGWRRQQQRPSDGRAGVPGEIFEARVGARSGGTGKSSTARGGPATATRGRRSGSGPARVGWAAHARAALAAKTPAPTPSAAQEARQRGAGKRGEGTGHTRKGGGKKHHRVVDSAAGCGAPTQDHRAGHHVAAAACGGSPHTSLRGAATYLSARPLAGPPRAPREG